MCIRDSINAQGNVLGMMPHPERAGEALVGAVRQLLHEGNIRRLTIKNDEGKTLIVVTHDEHIATRTERVIRLFDGRIDKEEFNTR